MIVWQDSKHPNQTDWVVDCLRYHGRVLTGRMSHWCYDWDELPVDETCPEFETCTCFPPDER